MKKLKLFNSLKNTKESFRARSNKVGLYVCGITPDASTHLGHAFVFTFFDVFIKYLKHLEYKTTYIQNFTDIDDCILKRSKKAREDWTEFGKKYTQEFLENMKWLNNTQPNFYPKATEHIREMIKVIEELQKKKFAYEKNGNVYFSIAKDKNYGKLSRLSKQEMLPIANERGNDPNDPNKKDPLDFILWQAKKPGEPSWPSPWGEGRPGWHIECSAMAMKYLGKTIDIQGGGSDLIFPHHESSIAQSESATGKQYARYWMHVGMVFYEKEKMSKSIGNVVLISDLKKKYSANTIRIFLLSRHYRTAWEFHEEDIGNAKETNELFESAMKAQSRDANPLDVSSWNKQFHEAMNDDLNTPKALKVLENLSRRLLKIDQTKDIKNAKIFLNMAFDIFGLAIEHK